jgi:TAT (twin-arginine translocation) pathway signal sequence
MGTVEIDRRQFLAAGTALGAAALLPNTATAQVVAAPASPKKVAAIVTTYFRYSHADNIVTRFMEGYSIVGKSYPPPCKVASLFIEQVNDLDIGRPLAKRWNVPVHPTIAEALTLGGNKLAVDGVVIVAEHGDYPTNARGQIEYPRRRFFEEVVKVFRTSKRAVPVFNDKHLSYSWDDARWMFEQSRELGFPMMAGSSVPVTYRHPDLRPKTGIEWEGTLSVGYGHFEVYGFHTLEALQVMTERRRGGETGVRAVQCLEGKEAWQAAAGGQWDRSLLDAALANVPQKGRGKVEEEDQNAIAYLIDYRDGLRAASYMSPRHVREFAFAGRAKGQKEPLACWYELPKPQRDHFSFLVQNAAQMMTTGKAVYPVERTLLTTGMLASLMESKANGHKRIETPQLSVNYQPPG